MKAPDGDKLELSQSATFWTSPEVESLNLEALDTLRVTINNPINDAIITEVRVDAVFYKSPLLPNGSPEPDDVAVPYYWHQRVKVRPKESAELYLYFSGRRAPSANFIANATPTKIVPLG
jgi:hypothetical protein